MLILENRTTAGDSDEIPHFGGTIQIQYAGVFDGATTVLQISQDGLPFISLTEETAIITAPDVVLYTVLKGAKYRLNVSGGGASQDISASVLC